MEKKKKVETVVGTILPNELFVDRVYRLLPVDLPSDYFKERTDRNIGWITQQEQQMLRRMTVGIAGCGGMGGLLGAILVRLGIGRIKIADTEVFDVSNLNRQFGANQDTIGKSKAFETARMLRQISPDVEVVVYPMGITEYSADHFVKDCTIICDEIEFWAIASRIYLHMTARKRTVSILNSPTVGHRVFVTLFTATSMHIETVLGFSYQEACVLQKKIQGGSATSKEIQMVMEAMFRIAAPEIPEYSRNIKKYSSVRSLRERFLNEQRASIISTNPPMATGFLANQVLFQLLQKSPNQRNFVLSPPMPGYVMFDAGLLKTKRTTKIWWNQKHHAKHTNV